MYFSLLKQILLSYYFYYSFLFHHFWIQRLNFDLCFIQSTNYDFLESLDILNISFAFCKFHLNNVVLNFPDLSTCHVLITERGEKNNYNDQGTHTQNNLQKSTAKVNFPKRLPDKMQQLQLNAIFFCGTWHVGQLWNQDLTSNCPITSQKHSK